MVTVGPRANLDGKQPSLHYSGLNAMTVTGSSVAVLNAAVVNAATLQSYSRKALTQSGVLLLIFSASATFAGEHSSAPAYGTAAEVMRKVVQNEIRAASDAVTRITFRGIKTTPKGSATNLYVETRQATAGEAVAYNGQPLSAEQRSAEEARIERFINNPAELKKKCEQDHETAERTLRIMRALPEALLFEYGGEEHGSETVGRAGVRLLKLTFRPKPGYEPPSHLEEVLTGLQGFVLVDPLQMRLASIDGTLFKDVAFGWGVLGHLNRGGRFVVQQQNVSDALWQVSSVTYIFTGKMLMVKTFNVNSTEIFSDFQSIPAELSLVQALELMKHQGSVLAANSVASNLAPKEILQPSKKR